MYNDPKSDKINKVLEDIEDVKTIARKNIDKVLERGDKLEALENKTIELEESSSQFKSSAVKAKNQMLTQRIIMTIILIAIILGVILVIVAIIAIVVGIVVANYQQQHSTSKTS